VLRCVDDIFALAFFFFQVIPVAYCLMQSKLEVAYVHILNWLRARALSFQRLVTDFERAQINAWRRVFGAVDHSGCLFHYVRAIHRAVGRLLLVVFVRNSPHAQKLVRRLCSLPRLPAERIGEGFTAVWREARRRGIYDEVYRLVIYVYNEWLLGVRPRNLSVYGKYHSTSNSCETHHHHLNTFAANRNPPTAWDVCGKMIDFNSSLQADFISGRCKSKHIEIHISGASLSFEDLLGKKRDSFNFSYRPLNGRTDLGVVHSSSTPQQLV
jgi:hypothetical protein